MNFKYIIFSTILSLTLIGCTDDAIYTPVSNGELDPGVEAYLSLSIDDFSVRNVDSRTENPNTDPDNNEPVLEKENIVKDLWVLQYSDDAEGKLLVSPTYYKISDQSELANLKVLLKENQRSKICVIANTLNSNWATADKFNTYENFKAQALPTPKSILFSDLEENPMPMEGTLKEVTISEGSIVEIPVTKMYAKLKIYFGELEEGLTPQSISVDNIPYYCRVGSLAENLSETVAANYDKVRWDTQPFELQTNQNEETQTRPYYVIYVPENLQGESANPGDKDKNDGAPRNALVVNVGFRYVKDGIEQTLRYAVYPGGNVYNNFNIRRNCVYRVKINVLNPENIHTPSSNCFVIPQNTLYSFEPYYRDEIGGIELNATEEENKIFRFNNYLDPNDFDAEGNPGDKVIDRVQILWQTKDAIGDNTEGDKVWIEQDPTNTKGIHRKIYVKTQSEGNALIGALNSKNEIIWSWHIWITDNKPDDPNKGVVYNTYDWIGDELEGNSIKSPGKIFSYEQGLKDKSTYSRVPGRRVMMCNLGAYDFEPTSNDDATIARTFGMLYQWGRKDPFPPLTTINWDNHKYDDVATGIHYDYTNQNAILKTNDDVSIIENGKIRQTLIDGTNWPLVKFSSIGGNNSNLLNNQISSSINYPYLFMCGTRMTYNGTSTNGYGFQGDWLNDSAHNDKLWGGKKPSDAKKSLQIASGVHIYDNYGDNKTIFDPCPSGWRVPPGDIWLGFSKTGTNPGSVNNVNYDAVATNSTKYGMYLYMEKSKWEDGEPGKSLFFPTQGTRLGDGWGFRCGTCGNYHNATTDINNRVNILHVHNASNVFLIFETSNYFYYVKSVAGPVRCVRDTNN